MVKWKFILFSEQLLADHAATATLDTLNTFHPHLNCILRSFPFREDNMLPIDIIYIRYLYKYHDIFESMFGTSDV